MSLAQLNQGGLAAAKGMEAMGNIERRAFLRNTAFGAVAGAALASPAIAQSQPKLKWRLASAYPISLDTLHGAAVTFSRLVSESTDGNFEIQVTGPGEIVSPGAGLEAVGNGTVEMAGTGSNIFTGVDPTFALASHVPLGVNTRMQNAFVYDGDGLAIWNEFFATHNIYMLPMASTGAQMGGWFRSEIGGVADLNGLKMRVGGLGGRILSELGVVPQNIPGGEVYAALERGTLDAAEWVGPYDDEKLGFVQVAKNYYFPGFWEGGSQGHFYFNLDAWNALPKSYQSIARTAAGYAHMEALAKYDLRSPAALRNLVAAGAQLKPFGPDIFEAAAAATDKVFAEISAENANFAKMLDHLTTVSKDGYLWWRFAEFTYDNYMIRHRS